MKNQKFILRLFAILGIGILLLKMTYESKYSSFFVDEIIFLALIIIGIVFIIWSLFTDIKQFKKTKKLIPVIPVSLGIVFTLVIWLWNMQINANFEKPSLLQMYYYGDYNGTLIDLKTDGTYIFDSSAIGLSSYAYGTYTINGNRILLDEHLLDNISTKHLEIKSKEIKYANRTEIEKYVFQIDTNMNVIENALEFRLVLDNRNE